jgi:hypothetical protein
MPRGLDAAQMEYLEEKLGVMNYSVIAKNLGKQPSTLDAYRSRKGLPSNRDSVDGIPIYDFAEAVGVRNETIYKYWIKQYGFPVKKVPVGFNNNKEMFVEIKKFWPWAWDHKHFVDFSKIQPGILGPEPDWVKEMRQLDFTDWGKKGWSKPWTPEEDLKLRNLMRLHKYNYRQISDFMQRTELAIQNRLLKTGEKLRPIEEERREWTQSEIEELLDLISQGYSGFQISRKLGRSEMSLKTKISRIKARDKHGKNREA